MQEIKNCELCLNDTDVNCVMAVNTLYQHCCISQAKIISIHKILFKKTQDLITTQRYIYSCIRWKRETYVKNIGKSFRGLFSGKKIG